MQSGTVSDNVDDKDPEWETINQLADELNAPEDFADDTAVSHSYVEIPDKTAKDDGKAKSGIPTVAEWQDFIGRTVLRFMTEGYLNLVLRDVEHLLTPRELEQIHLSRDDLREMAAPMAELANKSPALRKRGRLLVASADSIEAIWTLVFWMRRVGRIAKRHRMEMRQQQVVNARVMQPPTNANNGDIIHGTIRENPGQGFGATGTTNGVGPETPFFNPGTG